VKDDPIVEEILEVRRQLFADCKWELEGLMDRLKAREEEDRSRVVSGRREVTTNEGTSD